MNGKKLMGLVIDGLKPVVTFKKPVEDQEGYMECGMRGRLVGVREVDRSGDTICFQLDLREFDDFNKTFERSNYYDKGGQPTLTAREAGFYKPDETVYVASVDEIDCFEVEASEGLALYGRYTAEASGKTYVQWLEALVVSLEGKNGG